MTDDNRAWDLLMRRLDHQDDLLDKIHVEARRTNGRVTRLETVQKVIGWLITAFVTLSAALIAAHYL